MTEPTQARLPQRVLGRCGIQASAVGVGCWPLGGPDQNLGLPMGWAEIDEAVAVSGLQRAFELGATLFDTADVYGHGRSERLLGRLVAQVPRDAVVLVSKVGYFVGTAPHGYHPGHMRRQLEQTLENLGTDHLDVYSLHHGDFGPDDRYLDGAIEAMRAGFQNAAMRSDLQVYAARSYSLMRPPRISRRLIRSRVKSATGRWDRGGRSFRDR